MNDVESEVKEILREVEAFSIPQNGSLFPFDTYFEKYSTYVLICSLLATILFSLIEPFRVAALFTGLLFLMSCITFIMAQAISIVTTFKSPMKGYAGIASKRITRRADHVENLSKYHPDSLALALNVLEGDGDAMKKRLYLLVGAVEKVGLIPAGLALYFASSSAVGEDAGMGSYILMSFIFGLYGGALLGHRLIEIFSRNSSCLSDALVLATKGSE